VNLHLSADFSWKAISRKEIQKEQCAQSSLRPLLLCVKGQGFSEWTKVIEKLIPDF
jgi:hypothetical protein